MGAVSDKDPRDLKIEKLQAIIEKFAEKMKTLAEERDEALRKAESFRVQVNIRDMELLELREAEEIEEKKKYDSFEGAGEW